MWKFSHLTQSFNSPNSLRPANQTSTLYPRLTLCVFVFLCSYNIRRHKSPQSVYRYSRYRFIYLYSIYKIGRTTTLLSSRREDDDQRSWCLFNCWSWTRNRSGRSQKVCKGRIYYRSCQEEQGSASDPHSRYHKLRQDHSKQTSKLPCRQPSWLRLKGLVRPCQ